MKLWKGCLAALSAIAAADDAWIDRIFLGEEASHVCNGGVTLTREQCETIAETFFFNSPGQIIDRSGNRDWPVGCLLHGNPGGSANIGQVYWVDHLWQEQVTTGIEKHFPVCLSEVSPQLEGREETAFIAQDQVCPEGFEPIDFPHICKERAESKFGLPWQGATHERQDPCGCIERNGLVFWNWDMTCEPSRQTAHPVCWQKVSVEGGDGPAGRYHKVLHDVWCGPNGVFDCFSDREYQCIMPNGGGTGDCPGDFTTCETQGDETAADLCGCDSYANGASSSDARICGKDLGMKVGKWQTTCATYTTRAACEAACDADPDCVYMIYGWNPVGQYFRCAGFKTCNEHYEYWDGDVGVFIRPEVLNSSDATEQEDDLQNWYRKEVDMVGKWGGTCTCPNGESYLVGDHYDGCQSLACENGVWSGCLPHADPSGLPESAYHHKVTCAPVPKCADNFGANNESYCGTWCNSAAHWDNCGTNTASGVLPGGGDYMCHCGGCNSCQPAPWDSAE